MKKYVGDRMNATFRHEFYQADKALPFVGYSKFVGNNEAQNKEYLLEQYISRMLKNGYLEKSYAMNFFTNNNRGNDSDMLLVSINSMGYTLFNGVELYSQVDDLLKRFFQARNNPEAQTQILANRKRMGFQAEYWYDFKKKFKDRAELIAHCKLIKEKFGEGQHSRCTGYYWKMIELHNL